MAKRGFFSFLRKKRKEQEETPTTVLLSELRTIENRLSKTDTHESCINFIHSLKRYYSKMLKERYTLAFEEINNEVKKSKAFPSKFKKSLAEFNNKISKLEFSSDQITTSELNESINEFINLINDMENRRKENEKEQHKKKTEKKRKPKRMLWEKDKTKQAIERSIIRAYLFLDQANIEEAAKTYEKIKRDYSFLSEKEKEKVKGDILELFVDLKKELNKKNKDKK
ncbi:MAG TPA: hypothetical protein ENN46_03725 [Candidatus Woesearchaeota archaeon]|nr:hypothetical protein [Candidatus Woesearchaeota archaeon]